MVRGGGIFQTPSKQPKDSPMNHEESEDVSCRMSQLEEMVKRFKVDLDDLKKRSMRMLDLANLQIELEKRMRLVEIKEENGMNM